MRATELYFHVVLLIMLYRVGLTSESVDETQCVTIQMRATELYFHVVLFIMACKVVLTSESVHEAAVCNHSNESYGGVRSCGTVCYAVQCGSYF